jgi:hypothetical protein
MAKLTQGILGGVKGKIGNVVGSSWKGIPIIKVKPLSVANPQTAAQQAQRGRMTHIVAFVIPVVASVIKPLWDRFAVKMSGVNAFIQRNIDLFDNAAPSPPEDLVMSSGKMESTEILSVHASDGDYDITVNFPTDAGFGFKLATDLAYAMAYNRTKGECYGGGGTKTRADGHITIENLKGNLTGEVIDVWLAFKRADGTIVSGSSYFKKTVTAS